MFVEILRSRAEPSNAQLPKNLQPTPTHSHTTPTTTTWQLKYVSSPHVTWNNDCMPRHPNSSTLGPSIVERYVTCHFHSFVEKPISPTDSGETHRIMSEATHLEVYNMCKLVLIRIYRFCRHFSFTFDAVSRHHTTSFQNTNIQSHAADY